MNAMFENMIWGNIDYIIEGEAILPELIIKLLKKNNLKYFDASKKFVDTIENAIDYLLEG
ncbi:MAG: hypothetical protein ABJZ18_14985 [Algibacter sp.]